MRPGRAFVVEHVLAHAAVELAHIGAISNIFQVQQNIFSTCNKKEDTCPESRVYKYNRDDCALLESLSFIDISSELTDAEWEKLMSAANALGIVPQILEPADALLSARHLAAAQAYARKYVRDTRDAYEEALLRQTLQLRAPACCSDVAAICEHAQHTLSAAVGQLRAVFGRARLGCTVQLGYALATLLPAVSADAERRARKAATVARRQAIASAKGALIEMKERLLRLQAVQALSEPPSDARRARIVWATLQAFCGAAACVDDFRAFPGAVELPAVRDIAAAPLHALGGLQVAGGPVLLDGTASAQGRALFVSTEGVLCTVRREGTQDRLALRDLLSGRAVALAAPPVAWAAAHGPELYVGLEASPRVHFAPLRAVLDGRLFKEFASFAAPGPAYSAACDRAGDGWVLLLVGARTLARVDLRAKAWRTIKCDRRLDSIGPLSGIRVPGVLCVARAPGLSRGVLAVSEHGRTRQVSDTRWHLSALLPSGARPADLARAAVVDTFANVVFRGRNFLLCVPEGAPVEQPLVRLCGSVFVCTDARDGRPRVVRIAVP
eukprot:gnl/Chilomastix_cuspidata/5061.p1 GENE.gnl/Chilomastix_cuspidata/5061~~gnl/Chilomastix_cuspidata/5061.p1  ORF type:complete len:554 (-),score=152.00 gnl/Chilomastix_cuspidata/5061:762-2423(-)